MKDFKAYALRLLRIRERSEYELFRRLREKGAGEEEIKEVIGLLKEWGLVNDREFACEFARSKSKMHWSWLRIERTLRFEFRVAEEDIERARECYNENEVLFYYISRFKRHKRSEEFVRRHLYSKGFQNAFIERVIENLQ